MSSSKGRLRGEGMGAALAIRVTPRSKKNEVAGILEDGTVKIRLTAPPVDGKANRALIKFLAELLGVTRSSIQLIAGEKGRDKLVSILGIDPKSVNDRIMQVLEFQSR